MHLPLSKITLLATYLHLQTTLALTPIDPSTFKPTEIITRDVCIIGGGSAGTFASIRLQAQKKSIILIEQEDILGGHTNTYTDPRSGKEIDYGVVAFEDTPIVREYFAQLGIPLANSTFNLTSRDIDFRTGETVPLPPVQDLAPALARYQALLAKYPYLDIGFRLPDPVPEELVRPFADMVKKHNLTAAVEIIGDFTNVLGDWPNEAAIYTLKAVNSDVLRGSLGSFIRPPDRSNGAIYVKATEMLGEHVLLSSRVLGIDRSSKDWVFVLVKTPKGPRLIKAKKVIFAVPPKLDNLRDFNLHDKEVELFGQFHNNFFYNGVLKVKGLPQAVVYINRGADDPFRVPELPAVHYIVATDVADLKTINLGSSRPLSEKEAKRLMLDDVEDLKKAGVNVSDPEIVAFGDHSPYSLKVDGDAIAEGFYKEVEELQGFRNTFYTGAAFATPNSPAVWEFTEFLLKDVLKALG